MPDEPLYVNDILNARTSLRERAKLAFEPTRRAEELQKEAEIEDEFDQVVGWIKEFLAAEFRLTAGEIEEVNFTKLPFTSMGARTAVGFVIDGITFRARLIGGDQHDYSDRRVSRLEAHIKVGMGMAWKFIDDLEMLGRHLS